MKKRGFMLAVIVLSAAVAAASASAISKPQTFSLLEVSPPNSDQPLGDFTFDRPPVGGDRAAFTNNLYKWAGNKRGAKVGHDQVMISFITGFGDDFSTKATVLFTAQVFLPGGTVFAEGYSKLDPNGPLRTTLPVVGGTGTYSGVGGYVNVRDLGNGNTNKTNLEFHLLP